MGRCCWRAIPLVKLEMCLISHKSSPNPWHSCGNYLCLVEIVKAVKASAVSCVMFYFQLPFRAFFELFSFMAMSIYSVSFAHTVFIQSVGCFCSVLLFHICVRIRFSIAAPNSIVQVIVVSHSNYRGRQNVK